MSTRRTWRWLAVLAVLALVASACGDGGDDEAKDGSTESTRSGGAPAAVAGFDGKTITLGVISPTTGPVAVIGNPLTAGNQVYFDALNKAGGVGGKYKVELEVADSQYNPPVAVQQYQRLKGNVVMFAQLLGTPVVNALLPQLKSDGMVAQPASLDSFWVREPNLLALGGPYQIQAINAMDWWVNQQKHADDTMCFAGQEDPYGDAGKEGMAFAAEQMDFKIAADVRFAATDTDLSAQVGQLAAAGCDLVFLTGTPSVSGALLGTAAQAGFSPQWIGQSPTWVNALAASPVAPYLAARFLLVSEGPEWGDTSVAGMKKMLADIEAFAPDQGPDIYFAFGYAAAWAVDQVLEQAVKMGDLSHDGILKAMESLDEITTGGLLGDYKYGTAAKRVPPRNSRILKVVPGADNPLQVVSDLFASETAKAFKFTS